MSTNVYREGRNKDRATESSPDDSYNYLLNADMDDIEAFLEEAKQQNGGDQVGQHLQAGQGKQQLNQSCFLYVVF